MLFLVIFIIQAIIFGFATQTVIDNKGYDETWFWWGFFFGIIALIVACAKPQNIDYSAYDNKPAQPTYNNDPSFFGSNLSKAADQARNEEILASGGWRCSCGRTHAAYVSSCSCGKSKHDVLQAQYKQKQEEEQRKAELKEQEKARNQVKSMDEMSKASAIKEYKELLDSGIISQEEFDAKKKQLLGL